VLALLGGHSGQDKFNEILWLSRSSIQGKKLFLITNKTQLLDPGISS
jgi:hypothetical protein